MVLQTSWFAIQCAARVAQGLAVTELELTTLGHTVFVSIIYFCWWNKPLCVRCPINVTSGATIKLRPVDLNNSDGEEEASPPGMAASSEAIDPNDSDGPEIESNAPSGLVGANKDDFNFSWRIRLGSYLNTAHVGGFNTPLDAVLSIIAILILGTFGAIHCLGWYSHFPSHIEQVLWRVSALIVAADPIVMISFLRTGMLDKITGKKTSDEVTASLFIIPYICARISLIVLAFLALRDLPFAAYQTPSWTNFIPHL